MGWRRRPQSQKNSDPADILDNLPAASPLPADNGADRFFAMARPGRADRNASKYPGSMVLRSSDLATVSPSTCCRSWTAFPHPADWKSWTFVICGEPPFSTSTLCSPGSPHRKTFPPRLVTSGARSMAACSLPHSSGRVAAREEANTASPNNASRTVPSHVPGPSSAPPEALPDIAGYARAPGSGPAGRPTAVAAPGMRFCRSQGPAHQVRAESRDIHTEAIPRRRRTPGTLIQQRQGTACSARVAMNSASRLKPRVRRNCILRNTRPWAWVSTSRVRFVKLPSRR